MSTGLEDDDVIKLAAAGYTTAGRIKCATREGLKDSGLLPSGVDCVSRILGGEWGHLRALRSLRW